MNNNYAYEIKPFFLYTFIVVIFYLVFVSPAKQKRDICTAFPAASLSLAAAQRKLFCV